MACQHAAQRCSGSSCIMTCSADIADIATWVKWDHSTNGQSLGICSMLKQPAARCFQARQESVRLEAVDMCGFERFGSQISVDRTTKKRTCLEPRGIDQMCNTQEHFDDSLQAQNANLALPPP